MPTQRLLALALVALGCAFGAQAAAASDRVESRIVGGVVALPGEWPAMAGLFLDDATPGVVGYMCGGTVIAPTLVLTAAHCVEGFPLALDGSQVWIGGRQYFSPDPDSTLSAVRIHPGWNRATYNNDVAIVTLTNPTLAAPMPLVTAAQASQLATDDDVMVAGYGRTTSGGSTTNTLMQVQVKLISDANCGSDLAYDNLYRPATMVCAGIWPDGEKDSCQGDSGGPLTRDFSGTKVLIGIVSWGAADCAAPDKPGVYARVSAYTGWIAAASSEPTITAVSSTGPDVTVTWQAGALSSPSWQVTSYAYAITGSGESASRTSTDLAETSFTMRRALGGAIAVSVATDLKTADAGTATWAGTPTPTRAPIVTAGITGRAEAGRKLTASGSSDDPWAQTLTYQWRRDGRAIRGATGASYTVTRADAGSEITVTVSAANAAGSGAATSAPTARTTAAARPAGTTTRILGVRAVGHVLRASAPRATGYPTPTVRYQWLRNGKPIAKATGSSYRLAKADAGRSIRVRVTYANPLGRRTLESPAARVDSVIRSFPPRPSSRTIAIAGTPAVGSTLRATAPLASGYPAPTVRYQWLRNGKAIPRASKATYRLTTRDRGRSISVRVTYRNSLGQSTLQSRALTVR